MISRSARTPVIAEDVDSYSLSLDGQRVLIKHDKDYTVLDAKADAAKDDDTKKKLDLSPHAHAGRSAAGMGGDVRQ